MNYTEYNGTSFGYDSPIPGLHIYSNVFPGAMKFIEQLKQDGAFQREDYMVDKPYGKRSASALLDDSSPYVAMLSGEFSDVVYSYFQHYQTFPPFRHSWRFTEFQEGEFFGEHADDTFNTPRTVSMTHYPNDNYDGGEIEFLHFGVKIKPRAGQLFVFPASYVYKHKIHPVTSGTRYNAVTFFTDMTDEEHASRIDLVNSGSFVPRQNVFLARG